MHTEEIGALAHSGDLCVQVQSDDSRAARKQSIDAGFADAGGSAGHQCNLTRKHRRLAGLLQLGLFQIPVFDIEYVFRRQCLPAAEQRCAFNDIHRMRIKIGDDAGVFHAAA